MKAMIFAGKEKNIENYQLLIGKDYISAIYQRRRKDYKEFLEDVSSKFAERITQSRISLELGVLNGEKITQKGIIKTDKIDTELFELMLTKKVIKLSSGKFLTIPATNLN